MAMAMAMANDEKFCGRTHAKHEETLFVRRMFLIEELNTKFVEENRFRFFKRHLILFEIYLNASVKG